MDVALLGPLEIRRSGELIALKAAKERAVVEALALSPDNLVTSGRLIELLWGDEQPPSALTTLRSVVSRLRRALGSDVIASSERGLGYRLAVSPGDVDAYRFSSSFEAARSAADSRDYAQAERLLSRMLGWWRGDPLLDLADGAAAEGERVRLRELRLAAVERRFDVVIRLGRPEPVIGELEAELAVHPLRERLWALMMVALYRAGRQADALAAFQRARHLLDDQLGVEPGPELRELEAAVLAQSLASSRDVLEGFRAEITPTVPVASLAASLTAVVWVDDTAQPGDPTPTKQVVQLDDPEPRGLAEQNRMAWFPGVAEALENAVAVQQQYAKLDAGSRVSVHFSADGSTDAGAAVFGSVVMRAARPGQVLVSAAAAAACPSLPVGMGLLELGSHRLGLSGESAAERLYQLLHPELRAAFGPPATIETVPNNLAIPGSTMVDRFSDVRDLTVAITRRPLVTLLGPGGVGKTRLALHVAASSLGWFPDGAWLVDLSVTDEPDPIVNMIAGTLNLSLGVTRSPIDELLEQLRHRQVLIVLDNCEHLIEATAPIAAALAGLPTVHVIATSREALNIEAESVHVVAPLTVDDASQLFRHRARGAGTPSHDDEPVLRELCQRLDGLPLAIELAAGSTTVRTPRELLHSLSRGELHGRPRRDLPTRHRTLRTVAEDSYRLLSPPAKGLLRRLSIFAKDATFDAVVRVCAEDLGDPEALLATLVETSIVVADPHAGQMRYRLLETLRTYAREWLAKDQTEFIRVERRHGHWAAELSAQADAGLRSPQEREWYERLDHDFDEIRVAYARAMARDDIDLALAVIAPLQHYAIFRVRPQLYAMAAAAADHPRASGELAARADALAAWGAFAAFDLTAANRHAERALQRGTSSYTHAVTVSMQALAAGLAGDSAGAKEKFRQAMQRARRDNDPYWIAFLIGFGISSQATGTDLGVAQFTDEGGGIAAKTGIRSLQAFVAVGQGYTQLTTDPAMAAAQLQRGAALAEDAGCNYLAQYAHAGLTGLGERGRRTNDITDLVEQARRWHDTGDDFQAVINLLNLSDRLDRLDHKTESHHLRSAIVTMLRKPADRNPETIAAIINQADKFISGG